MSGGEYCSLIHRNGLSIEISANPKFFTAVTLNFSLFEMHTLASNSNNDLAKTNRWMCQLKFDSKSSISNQAQKTLFSCKTMKQHHLEWTLNDNQVIHTPFMKHLVMFSILKFWEQFNCTLILNTINMALFWTPDFSTKKD